MEHGDKGKGILIHLLVDAKGMLLVSYNDSSQWK